MWLLDPAVLGPDLGWRLAFGSGAVLGLVILFLRRFLPESPRWLMLHGQPGEAARVVSEIEARVVASEHVTLPPVTTLPLVGRDPPHDLGVGRAAHCCASIPAAPRSASF